MGAMTPFGSQAWAQTSNAAPTVKRGEPITLNFSNAEIEAVARTMAIMTGRNVVVDPRVKGTMTLVSDSPMSPARAYNHFLAVLRSMGYAVVQSDGLDKVVPEADAKLIGGSAVFGIGWGIAGFCPGASIPALGLGHASAAIFVAALLVGILIARRLAKADFFADLSRSG